MNAPISAAAERALILWDRYNEQKGHCRGVGEATEEQCEANYDVLLAIEHLLQDAMPASVQALGAILIIEIWDAEDNEHIPGFYRASLAALRPQLVGAIAEDADRVLAQENEEART